MTENTILDTITAHTRRDLAARMQVRPLAEARAAAQASPPARDFASALRTPGLSLIAEVKRASPSKGLLRPDFDPAALARAYAANGAAAVSVLTDAPFFQGHLEHLRAVRAAIDIPVLRKDFVLTPYQVYEARAAGADALLLIVAVLNDAELGALHRLARELGMAVLVEAHDAGELERALRVAPQIVGINNRDLRTFEVRLETTLRLRDRVPPGVILVAESGIRSAEDAARLETAGVDAMLVGEALVRAPDVGRKVRELTRREVPVDTY